MVRPFWLCEFVGSPFIVFFLTESLIAESFMTRTRKMILSHIGGRASIRESLWANLTLGLGNIYCFIYTCLQISKMEKR